jgi:hypothetical protein
MKGGVQEPADVGHEDHGVHGGRALLLGRQSQRTPNHVLGQALGDLPADSGKQGRRDARHGLSSNNFPTAVGKKKPQRLLPLPLIDNSWRDHALPSLG